MEKNFLEDSIELGNSRPVKDEVYFLILLHPMQIKKVCGEIIIPPQTYYWECTRKVSPYA